MNASYSSFFQNFNVKLLIASLNVCAPNWGEKDCCYNYHKFYYFQEGDATIQIQQDIYHPKKGELFLIPAGVRHSYSHDPEHPVYKYWCHFSILPSDTWHFNYHRSTIFCTPDPAIVTPLFEQLIHTYQSPSALSTLHQISVLTELCYEFFRNVNYSLLITETKNSFQATINSYLSEHLTEKIGLQELAAITHLQKNYFISKFKKEFGTTPINYINLIRLDRISRHLIENPSAGIIETALSYGFEDYRYFNRLFKQRFGISPSTFRNSFQA
jgi:AraC family transcriptional regulator of arabinose operon